MPNYAGGPIRVYVEDLARRKPAPGGGSGAALAGALGAAAASMAANFTIGREKYADVEPQVKAALANLDRVRAELLTLVDEDVKAYSQVGPAYQMPRTTEQEKAARAAAIQEALHTACGVPLRVCAAALEALVEALEACEALVNICNRMLVSDVAVGAMLAEAAFRGAQVNVEINLNAMKDAEFVAATRTKVAADARAAREMHDRVTAAAAERMNA